MLQAIALCQFLENNQQQVNLLDKAVLEIGAGTGLLSIVACLLGESISGVGSLADRERQAGHVSPPIIPNDQMPASQRDPGLWDCLAHIGVKLSHHECQMQDAILFYAIQSEAKDQNISLNPALTLPTLLCDAGMSFVPDADNFFGMPSKHSSNCRMRETESCLPYPGRQGTCFRQLGHETQNVFVHFSLVFQWYLVISCFVVKNAPGFLMEKQWGVYTAETTHPHQT